MAPVFVAGGHTYSIDPMRTTKQLHCLRRLTHLVEGLGESLTNLQGQSDKLDLGRLLIAFLPLFDRVGSMKDADTTYIFAECLSTVKRSVDGEWRPVWVVGRTDPEFADIDLVQMFEMAGRVLAHNFSALFGDHMGALAGLMNEVPGTILAAGKSGAP
ncbi:phage tail assembly chaperone [Methylobacterium ajmalii]|jgi:hypothetical protein|uniref:phage tail assembly chaperone n=1 Tax=Methylobacterium ajmalii TaxID=2738439 RepID=UPI00190D2268|nr:hypothetical protein [Methylobacterium ajmalii]MBK3400837.1 hypothetical protein [Methylobacterium ajmalii]MBK3412279.1 hypothetical protein [Methylobacterium ajmalii]MBK3426880.1 hypothetical protein [Methylobacterium ajmalii]MBZ6416935.1 hypothetical protein [Methylobacterium sp.]